MPFQIGAPRTLTTRGRRAFSNLTAMPREVGAVAHGLRVAESKTNDLVKASTPEAVSSILSDSYAEAVMDVAVRKDPYTAIRSLAIYNLHASTDGTLQDFDFMKTATMGAEGSGQPGIYNNLLDDRQPFKPCLIHTIGVGLLLAADAPHYNGLQAFAGAWIEVLRDRSIIFDAPLLSCITSLILLDTTATTPKDVKARLNVLAGGGLELEGHGAPFEKADALSVWLHWFPGSLAGVAAAHGKLLASLLVDGEAMEV